MFYFRVDRVRFLDNGGVKPGLGVFGNDFAKVKFLSFVTPSNLSLPDLDRWVSENDQKARKAAMAALVSQSVQSRILTEVDRIRDKGEVLFGDTGLVLYQAEEIPEEFTWTFLAMRSKRDLREAALDASQLLGEGGSKTATNQVFHLLKSGAAANPAYAAGLAVSEFVARAALRRLGSKKDRQLGAVTTSFIRPLHYPMGIRDACGVQDSTGNMFYDYSIFGYKRAIAIL